MQTKKEGTADNTGAKSKGRDKGIIYPRSTCHNTNQSIEMDAGARGKELEFGIGLCKHHGFDSQTSPGIKIKIGQEKKSCHAQKFTKREKNCDRANSSVLTQEGGAGRSGYGDAFWSGVRQCNVAPPSVTGWPDGPDANGLRQIISGVERSFDHGKETKKPIGSRITRITSEKHVRNAPRFPTDTLRHLSSSARLPVQLLVAIGRRGYLSQLTR